MVALTEGAGALLRRIQSEQTSANTLRMTLDAEELVVTATAAAPDDEILYHGDMAVLRLSRDAALALYGCTLAARITAGGEELAVVDAGEALGETDT